MSQGPGPSGMLSLFLCLVSALPVSLPFPSAPHTQICGWSALSALLPPPLPSEH